MWIYGVLLLAVYLGANAYLFWRVLALISGLPFALRITIGVAFWLAALMLFAAMALRNVDISEVVARTMFNIGSVWLVFLLYAVMLTLLFDLVHCAFPKFCCGTPTALIFTLLIMGIGYINYRNPRVEEIEIESDKIDQDLRLAVVSDVHLGYGTTRRLFAEYVELINSQRADVVLIVGDLVDNSLRPVREQHVDELCAKIEATRGVYMVLGNHEYISGVDDAMAFINDTPITLLRDSVAVPCEGVAIIGRDDRTNRHRKSLKTLVSQANSAALKIVLDHQPYEIPVSNNLGIDVHISGHTHRGQVWPLSWLVDAMYEQSHGYRKWSTTHAFVSSGLSLWGPPFRIGTRSEIVVITLKSPHQGRQ